MEKTDRHSIEPSFPEPFEHFDQELAPDIAHLQEAMNQLEYNQKELRQALKDMKNVLPPHPNYSNHEAVVQGYQKNIREWEGKVQEYQAKTYGRMERILQEHEVEPELAAEVMTTLDAKVHPEKQENKSPDEDKTIIPEDKETESVNPAVEKQADITQTDKTPPKQDYTISLIQRKHEQQKQRQQQKAEISEKTNEIGKSDGKEPIPASGSLTYQLNYQLKYQKLNSREQPKEKLVKDFSKNNKDISPDKD